MSPRSRIAGMVNIFVAFSLQNPQKGNFWECPALSNLQQPQILCLPWILTSRSHFLHRMRTLDSTHACQRPKPALHYRTDQEAQMDAGRSRCENHSLLQ